MRTIYIRKLLINILSIIMFITTSTYGDSPVTRYTPRGSTITNTYSCDEASNATRQSMDDYIEYTYPSATLLYLPGESYSSSLTYNCHGYAWHMTEEGVDDPVWIGYLAGGTAEDVYWEDDSYGEISESNATKVSYSGDHSAITTGTADVYISKWGAYSLVQHSDTYVPGGFESPNKYYKLNRLVPETYATIASAVSAAASGEKVVVSSGDHTISANLTISSNITLKIYPGADIEFGTDDYLRIDGTIIAEGTSEDMITFDKSGASDWGGIQFGSSSDDSKCILSYCDIDHTKNYGIYCFNSNPRIEDCTIQNAYIGIYLNSPDASSTTVKDNTISNNTYGIYQYNGDSWIYDNDISYCSKGIYILNGSPKVQLNTVHNNTNEGIFLSGTDGAFTHNRIYSNSGDGVYCYNYSNPSFKFANMGSNVVRDNGKNGVKIASTSRPVLSAYSNPDDATNSFYNNDASYYDVYSLQSQKVYAQYDYWGPGGGSTYGDVDTTGGRDSGPSKLIALGPTPAPSNADALKILEEGYHLEVDEKYDEALDKLKTVISDYPESFEAMMALSRIRMCLKLSERLSEYESYLNSIYQPNKDRLLGGKVLEMQIPLMVKNKSYSSALSACESIIKNFPENEIARGAEFASWMIQFNDLEDLGAAKTVMDQYGGKYVNDDYHIFMKLSMGEITSEQAENLINGQSESQPSNENDLPLSIEVSDNYPNPFNPETSIQIRLPIDSDVKLQVFNIRGQVVATPFDGNLPAGSHTVNFNASALSSGVYFYKIVAGEFSDVKRMVLLK